MKYYSHFSCLESKETLTIVNFLNIDEEANSRRFQAVRNDRESLVLHLVPVKNVFNDDNTALCQGTREAEILPVLLRSSVSVTEVCTMFLIEASGEDIVYRSRACSQIIPSLFRSGKCHSCLGLVENIKQLEQLVPSGNLEENSTKGNFKEESFKTKLNDDYSDPDDDNKLDTQETNENESEHSENPRVINFTKKIKLTDKVSETPSKRKFKYRNCFKCQICSSKTFSSKGGLAYHYRTYHKVSSEPMSKCLFCEDKFRKGSVKFIKHMKFIHESMAETEAYKNFFLENAPAICPQCGLECPNETSLQSHAGVCNGSKVVTCHICGKKLKIHHPTAFENHLQRHKTDETVVCPHCGKVYNNKMKLSDHIRACGTEGKDSVKCPQCDNVFAASYVKLHIRRVHKKVKNAACDQCGKSFFNEKKLSEHITAMHDKIKPFICDLCGFKTAKMGNLNIHRQKSHGAPHIGVRAIWEMIQNGKHPYIDNNYEFLHLLKPKHGGYRCEINHE